MHFLAELALSAVFTFCLGWFAIRFGIVAWVSRMLPRCISVFVLLDKAIWESGRREHAIRRIGDIMRASSDRFRKKFNIRFSVAGIEPCPVEMAEWHETISALEGYAAQYPKGMVLAFTHEPLREAVWIADGYSSHMAGSRGIASPWRGCAIIGDLFHVVEGEIIALREIAHIFGADHAGVNDPTIMNPSPHLFTRRLEFDAKAEKAVFSWKWETFRRRPRFIGRWVGTPADLLAAWAKLLSLLEAPIER